VKVKWKKIPFHINLVLNKTSEVEFSLPRLFYYQLFNADLFIGKMQRLNGKWDFDALTVRDIDAALFFFHLMSTRVKSLAF